MLGATTANIFSTSEHQKAVRTWCMLHILIWKCALRHNGLHFFDISTCKGGPNLVTWCVLHILTWKCVSRHNGKHFLDISTFKSGPGMMCFVHFDLGMCFAPQRRALFQHLNFQQWSRNGVFCTCRFLNVLSATTAKTFPTSGHQKVVRTWCMLHLLTWKCASRCNGVLFPDIFFSKSGPRMACFLHFDLDMCFARQPRAIFYLSSRQMALHLRFRA